MMTLRKTLIASSVLLAACSATEVPLAPYKMDIRQGNYITQQMLDQIDLGMTKQEAQYILGTPMINDAFHGDRWDYVYSLEKQGEVIDRQHLTLFFDNSNKLVKVNKGAKSESITTPTEVYIAETASSQNAPAQVIAPQAAAVTAKVEPTPPAAQPPAAEPLVAASPEYDDTLGNNQQTTTLPADTLQTAALVEPAMDAAVDEMQLSDDDFEPANNISDDSYDIAQTTAPATLLDGSPIEAGANDYRDNQQLVATATTSSQATSNRYTQPTIAATPTAATPQLTASMQQAPKSYTRFEYQRANSSQTGATTTPTPIAAAIKATEPLQPRVADNGTAQQPAYAAADIGTPQLPTAPKLQPEYQYLDEKQYIEPELNRPMAKTDDAVLVAGLNSSHIIEPSSTTAYGEGDSASSFENAPIEIIDAADIEAVPIDEEAVSDEPYEIVYQPGDGTKEVTSETSSDFSAPPVASGSDYAAQYNSAPQSTTYSDYQANQQSAGAEETLIQLPAVGQEQTYDSSAYPASDDYATEDTSYQVSDEDFADSAYTPVDSTYQVSDDDFTDSADASAAPADTSYQVADDDFIDTSFEPSAEEIPIDSSSAQVSSSDFADSDNSSDSNNYQAPAANAETEVLEALQKWGAAWTDGDVESYISSYSTNFNPGNMSHSAWEEERRQNFANAGKTSVDVYDLAVEMHSNDHASVTFRQEYRSDISEKSSNKSLQLRKMTGVWYIVSEYPAEGQPTSTDSMLAGSNNDDSQVDTSYAVDTVSSDDFTDSAPAYQPTVADTSSSPFNPAAPTENLGDMPLDAESKIAERVESWRYAWSMGDISGYLNSYARSFKPNGRSYNSWKKQRTKRIAGKNTIEVSVSELQVEVNRNGSAVASFRQDYRSPTYQDSVKKVLNLEYIDNQWLIVAEFSSKLSDKAKIRSTASTTASRPSVQQIPINQAPIPDSGQTAEVLQTVQSWGQAWSAGDIEGYLAQYDSQFAAKGMSRSAWEKQRRKRVTPSKKIVLEISEVKVTLTASDSATVTFRQDYKSKTYRDTTRKTLKLSNYTGRWLITSETSR